MKRNKNAEVEINLAKRRGMFQKNEDKLQKNEAEDKVKANPTVDKESVDNQCKSSDNKCTYGDSNGDQSAVPKHSSCDCCGDCDCDHTTCDCDCEDSDVNCHCDDEYDGGCDTVCGCSYCTDYGNDTDTDCDCDDTKDDEAYNCRICGKSYNELESAMACEQECLKKLRENQAKKAFEEKHRGLLDRIDSLKRDKQKMVIFLEGLDKEIDKMKEDLHEVMDGRDGAYHEYKDICRELANAEQELAIKEDQNNLGSQQKKTKSFRKSIVNGRAVYEVDGKEVDRKTYEEAIRNYRIKTSGPYWWEF